MSVTITQARNAQYINADGDFEVEINHPDYGWIPYTVDSHDNDTTIDNEEIKALVAGQIAAYVAPTQAELDTEAGQLVRKKRAEILRETVDPVVSNTLRFNSMTTEKQAEWTAYRTSLLDITDQSGFPHNVTWPTKPD